MSFKNLIIFCLLMQEENGVFNKSPDYIKKTFQTLKSEAIDPKILNPRIKKQLEQYFGRWKIKNGA